MKSNIYISSLAFLGESIENIIETCIGHNINLEFSSGLPFGKNMIEVFTEAPIKKISHNYFPAPRIPYVINLASNNERIRRKSIEHCKMSLELANKNNVTFFAAHAGFCIDPKPEELGAKILLNEDDINIELHKRLFISSVTEILDKASELETDFLIENNVLAKFNYNKINPLLCCDSMGIKWLFDSIDHDRFGLLLDTAHLKVSSNTLNLNIVEEYSEIREFVKAVHHSDNDGFTDTNKMINENYWFLQFLPNHKEQIHVLEVKKINLDQIFDQVNILEENGLN